MTNQEHLAMNFEALADSEYAQEVGREHSDAAWILSDRDVWYKNPFYSGPEVQHPESVIEYYDDDGVLYEMPANTVGGWSEGEDDIQF